MDIEQAKNFALSKIRTDRLTEYVRDEMKNLENKKQKYWEGFKEMFKPLLLSQEGIKKSIDTQQNATINQLQANQDALRDLIGDMQKNLSTRDAQTQVEEALTQLSEDKPDKDKPDIEEEELSKFKEEFPNIFSKVAYYPLVNPETKLTDDELEFLKSLWLLNIEKFPNAPAHIYEKNLEKANEILTNVMKHISKLRKKTDMSEEGLKEIVFYQNFRDILLKYKNKTSKLFEDRSPRREPLEPSLSRLPLYRPKNWGPRSPMLPKGLPPIPTPQQEIYESYIPPEDLERIRKTRSSEEDNVYEIVQKGLKKILGKETPGPTPVEETPAPSPWAFPPPISPTGIPVYGQPVQLDPLGGLPPIIPPKVKSRPSSPPIPARVPVFGEPVEPDPRAWPQILPTRIPPPMSEIPKQKPEEEEEIYKPYIPPEDLEKMQKSKEERTLEEIVQEGFKKILDKETPTPAPTAAAEQIEYNIVDPEINFTDEELSEINENYLLKPKDFHKREKSDLEEQLNEVDEDISETLNEITNLELELLDKDYDDDDDDEFRYFRDEKVIQEELDDANKKYSLLFKYKDVLEYYIRAFYGIEIEGVYAPPFVPIQLKTIAKKGLEL